MKINSVYISAFGKFNDKTFDFSDGLNIIYGENEDGKTTLMNFIRMMFYGTTGKSNEELLKNPRKKYAPRNDKAMAGRIDFEVDGKKYRIERIFKRAFSATELKEVELPKSLSVLYKRAFPEECNLINIESVNIRSEHYIEKEEYERWTRAHEF